MTVSQTDRILKFEMVFKEHFEDLVRFGSRIIRDPQNAKDLVHEVFTSVWEKQRDMEEQWMNPAKVRGYLFTAVNNRCLNYIRDRRKMVRMDSGVEGASDSSSDMDLQVSQLEEQIHLVIESLPDRCREIFKLSRFEGKKYSEIAEKLGISSKTVEVQMSKALRIMREKLADFLMIICCIFLTFL